jgi:tetratricopeptide (TPR) repeat protein
VTETKSGDVWRKRLRTPLLPAWLRDFEVNPDDAINLALREEYDFGRQTPHGPVAILLRLARILSDSGDFTKQLDDALERWVTNNWRRRVDVTDRGPISAAWSNLFDLVAFHPDFAKTAATLRVNFHDRAFLEEGDSGANGIFKRYLRAVARTQSDRSLEPYWRTLAGLPVGVPVDHAALAVEGTVGLPRPDGDLTGGFRPDVARVTFLVAEALERLSDEGIFERKEAIRQASQIAASAVTSYPFREQWNDALDAHHSRRDEWRRWIGLNNGGARSSRSGVSQADARAWRDRAHRVAERLRADEAGAELEAERLLDEERSHARATWNTSFVAKSLTLFASALFEQNPERARDYAQEALDWAPDDPYCYGAYVHGLAVADGPSIAIPHAWHSVERFGENAVNWTELGWVLRTYGALQTAANVLTHASFLFPEDQILTSHLAETLGLAGRYADAAKVLIGLSGRAEEAYPAATKWLVKLRTSAPNELSELLGTQASKPFAAIDVKELARVIGSPISPPTGLPDLPMPEVADSRLTRAMYLGDFRVARSVAAVTNRSELAESVSKKLIVLRALFPDDVAVASEELLLEDASDASITAASELSVRFPRSIAAAYAHARLNRRAWEGRQLRDAAAQAPRLTMPWQALLDRDAQLAPLFDLGQSRAFLGVRDGEVVEEAAASALRSLARWVAEARETDESTPFEAVWARSAESLLALDGTATPDLGLLRLKASTSYARLDSLEENFAYRAESVLV